MNNFNTFMRIFVLFIIIFFHTICANAQQQHIFEKIAVDIRKGIESNNSLCTYYLNNLKIITNKCSFKIIPLQSSNYCPDDLKSDLIIYIISKLSDLMNISNLCTQSADYSFIVYISINRIEKNIKKIVIMPVIIREYITFPQCASMDNLNIALTTAIGQTVYSYSYDNYNFNEINRYYKKEDEENAWDEANGEPKTIAKYEKFIKDYPNSKKVGQAQDEIIKLEPKEAFKACKTICDYNKFIEKFHQPQYTNYYENAKESRNRLYEEETKAWDNVGLQGLTKEACEEFLQQQFPCGNFEDLAKKRISNIDKYDSLIKQADIQYKRTDFRKALDLYKDAAKVPLNRQYPKDKIKEIELLISEYDKIIASADKLFNKNGYKECISIYEKARDLMPHETYATERIAKAKELLFAQQETGGVFEDIRDGKSYKWVKIGNQKWIAENLAYKPTNGNYWAYNNNSSNISVYGYLYNYETAQNVCPNGWHLPSKPEINELIEYIKNDEKEKAGLKMKSLTGWNNNGNGKDLFGFNALPAGFRTAGGNFEAINKNGYWWTVDATDTHGSYFYLSSESEDIASAMSVKQTGMSVRCIKNKSK